MHAQRQSRPRVCGITIDGVTSQDLDDAILVQPQDDGILCQVHITDVDAVVPQGSAVDEHSAQQIETVYRANYNLPMLPRRLSDKQCSLQPGGERPTLTVSWTLGRDGSIATSPHIFLSRFISQGRWTYPGFDDALAKDNAQCQLLRLVAEHLYRLRGGESAALGRSFDGLGYLDEDGKLLTQPFHSQMIVAEFAIAANWFVAEYARRQQLPLLFRNQSASSEQLASPLVQQLLEIGDASELQRCLSTELESAEYGVECRGHFGLALDAYCHFTSPIRRYVDLLNHRQLKAQLTGRGAAYGVEELTAQAVRINSWQTSVRSERRQYFKDKAHDQTQRQLAQPQDLARLSPKEFTRALIAACKSEKLDMLAQEVTRRCQQGNLPLVDIRWVLMRGGLPEVQAQLLEQLSPTDAISLVTMNQADEGIESVRWDFQSAGARWAALAVCTAQGQELSTPYIAGANKQDAKGKAAKALLEGWVYESLIPLEWVEPWQPKAMLELAESPPAVDPQPQSETDINYIGELNTMAQKQGVAMPDYQFVANAQGGFRACVQWLDLAYEAEGSSKKRAKAAVAKLLWHSVQQHRPGSNI